MKSSDRNHSSKIGYILFPMLLFTLVFDAASAGISSFFSRVADERGTEARNFLLRNAGNVSAVCTAISAAIAFLSIGWIARREINVNRAIDLYGSERGQDHFSDSSKSHSEEFGEDKYGRKSQSSKRTFSTLICDAAPVAPDILAVMAVGIVLFSLFLNAALSLTGAVGADAGAEAASRQTGNVSLLLGVLVYGILTPFCEEIVFRGITFQRACWAFSFRSPCGNDNGIKSAKESNRNSRNCNGNENRNPLSAPTSGRLRSTTTGILISSLLFGAYHGNPVQGFYAFCMGVLFCLFVLKCDRFYYVIMLHGSVNMIT